MYSLFEQKIVSAITDVLNSNGFNIVRVKYFDEPAVLQIMIENEDGNAVNVEQCAKVSRMLSPRLDIEDFLPDSYNLEVSSAGLDRPLVKIEDFCRFKGQKIGFKIKGKKKKKIGIIKDVNKEAVTLALEEKEMVLNLDDFSSANLLFE